MALADVVRKQKQQHEPPPRQEIAEHNDSQFVIETKCSNNHGLTRLKRRQEQCQQRQETRQRRTRQTKIIEFIFASDVVLTPPQLSSNIMLFVYPAQWMGGQIQGPQRFDRSRNNTRPRVQQDKSHDSQSASFLGGVKKYLPHPSPEWPQHHASNIFFTIVPQFRSFTSRRSVVYLLLFELLEGVSACLFPTRFRRWPGPHALSFLLL